MTESPTTSPTDTEEKFVDATESHMRERFFGAPDIKQKSGAPAPRSKAQSRNCEQQSNVILIAINIA